MKEVCFCGRVEDLEDREPVLDRNGEWALLCTGCGHADYLRWLPNEVRLLVLDEACSRPRGSAEYPGAQAA